MARSAIAWVIVGLAAAVLAAAAASRNQAAVHALVAPRPPPSAAPAPSEFEVEWLAPSAVSAGH